MAAMDESVCPVCYGDLDIATTYTMTCGSVDTKNVAIPHNICNECEHVLRMRAPLRVDASGNINRVIICPLCKVEEGGDRRVESLMREIQATNAIVVSLIRQVPPGTRVPGVLAARVPRSPRVPVVPRAPRAPRVPRVPRVGDKQWCQIKNLRGERVCATKGKTARKCTDGCGTFICRSCRTC